jgi:predicted transcriptional regulator
MANPRKTDASRSESNDGTVSTSVRLSREMREAFEEIAELERRTLGNVLRNALEDWLAGRGMKR